MLHPPHAILYAPLPSCTHFLYFLSQYTLSKSLSIYIVLPPLLTHSHPHAASSSQLLHSQTLHPRPPTFSPLSPSSIPPFPLPSTHGLFIPISPLINSSSTHSNFLTPFHAMTKAYTTHKTAASFFTVPHFYAFTPLQNKAQ